MSKHSFPTDCRHLLLVVVVDVKVCIKVTLFGHLQNVNLKSENLAGNVAFHSGLCSSIRHRMKTWQQYDSPLSEMLLALFLVCAELGLNRTSLSGVVLPKTEVANDEELLNLLLSVAVAELCSGQLFGQSFPLLDGDEMLCAWDGVNAAARNFLWLFISYNTITVNSFTKQETTCRGKKFKRKKEKKREMFIKKKRNV